MSLPLGSRSLPAARVACGFLLVAAVVRCSPAADTNGPATGGTASHTGGVPLITGGNPSTGGISATGGSSVTGGTPSNGGVASTGGTTLTGGTASTGGTAQAGQAGNSNGGIAAAGGNTGTGGANTSGASNGGTNPGGSNTGGASVGGATSGGAHTGGTSTGGANGGSAGTGGSATGGSATGGTGGSTHIGPWRIAPFGDSITGTTCYPQLLSKQLKDNGKTNFNFVGGILNNQSCNGAPNVQTEGHGGYKVTDLVSGGAHASELSGWCSTDDADIVLFHYGTNDAWSPPITTASITSAYTTVLQCLRSANPSVIVFVAKIIPMHPAGCEASNCQYNQRVIELNAAIPAWASANSTGASPIYVVDVYSAFNADQYLPSSTNTADGVHPNPAGSALIASKWYDALLAHTLP